jgi:hypothetical protein
MPCYDDACSTAACPHEAFIESLLEVPYQFCIRSADQNSVWRVCIEELKAFEKSENAGVVGKIFRSREKLLCFVLLAPVGLP